MRVSYDGDVGYSARRSLVGNDFSRRRDGNTIVHFSDDDKPVLMEILDAGEFLTQLTKAAITANAGEFVDLTA